MEIRKKFPVCVEDVAMSDEELCGKIFSVFQHAKCKASRIPLKNLTDALENAGLRMDDPRLQGFAQRAKQIEHGLDLKALISLIGGDLPLISAALKGHLVIRDFKSFCRNVYKIYQKCVGNERGRVATYIPELAKIDSHFWGISVCTVDGQRYSHGDCLVPFTLQSCCKPLSYAMALQELGSDKVHDYVGHEPSGMVFNALELDVQDKPHNPMINPGAIIISGLLLYSYPDKSDDEILEHLMSLISKMAGDEPVRVNENVFASEKSTGYRNFAIAYLMMEKKCFPPTITVEDVLNFYFKSCSIEVNCEMLAVIAATLANGGMCPLTNEVVLQQSVVGDVMSLMQSCGMYDYSGQFAFEIGLPAKSGVSGGLLLIIPSIMGIGMWSPGLDKLGNSARCLQFCQELLEVYSLHPYADLGHSDPQKEDISKRSGRIHEENVVRILFAAAKGDIDALQCYFLRGMNMETVDYGKRSALHEAAAAGQLQVVKFLVETCKVDPNPRDSHGYTPLKEAIEFKKEEVAAYLESRNAVI